MMEHECRKATVNLDIQEVEKPKERKVKMDDPERKPWDKIISDATERKDTMCYASERLLMLMKLLKEQDGGKVKEEAVRIH